MENNLKFNSAICTSREQSERLLALGLKKETADCYLVVEKEEVTVVAKPYYEIIEDLNSLPFDAEIIPAWSMHRMIELAYGNWKEDIAPVYLGNSYDMLIGRIEFQIKRGIFNKEYLV